MSQYKNIFLENESEHGSIEGYSVLSGAEQIGNWMSKKGYSSDTASRIRDKYHRISIIKSMYVDESERNKGIGSELLERFIEEATLLNSECILLEADTGEENDIELVNWYEEWGFEIIERDRKNHPLMMKIIMV